MDLVLLGAGGHAKDVIKNIEEYNEASSAHTRIHLVGCIDDREHGDIPQELLGYEIFRSLEVFKQDAFRATYALCAVGDPINKKLFVEKAAPYGVKFASVIHPSVTVHRSTEVGAGVVIFAQSAISSCCRIRDHATVNYRCSISHDCRIEAYATLSPAVAIGGRVVVGEGAFMGISASCVHNVEIGAWSIVGAGTVIISDVGKQTIVVGNPQKELGERQMVPIL